MLVIHSFRASLLRSAGPQSFRRFLKLSEDYIDCVAKEAEYRDRNHILDLESFKHLRRRNSGAPVVFGLIECTLGIDLPDEVFEDANILETLLGSGGYGMVVEREWLIPFPPAMHLQVWM